MEQDNYPKVYLYKRIVQAKLFIDANFTDNIDLSGIADEACFSRFHFLRLFKSAYGKTPHQYLTARRMDYAIQLLKEGRAVTEVCYASGFESLGSFSVLFKKITGFSPAAYQMQQRQLLVGMQQRPLQYVPGCFARTMVTVQ